MIQLKATCRQCEGTGYSLDFCNTHTLFCPNCKGIGVLILTAENWDIELEQRPKGEIDINQGFRDVMGVPM